MQQLSGVNIGNCVGVRHLAYVYGISGVNTFFFGGGAKFFLPRREEDEARDSKGRQRGRDSWRGVSEPLLTAMGSGERCKLPQLGPGRAPENLKFDAT